MVVILAPEGILLLQVVGIVGGARYGTAVVNLEGAITRGPYPDDEVLHEPFNGKVLLIKHDGMAQKGGVFILDVATGEAGKVCDTANFLPWVEKMPQMAEPSQWRLSHATWSKDGAYLAVCLENSRSPFGEYLFSFRPDFSDVVFFGKKPTHFNWYDDHRSIWGNDHSVSTGRDADNSLKRWSRDGKLIEPLSGPPANHNAMSPDKQWFAGESWYGWDPVLYLYRMGRRESVATLMKHGFQEVTWILRAHVNPAFSRDGKRLYYNRATSAKLNEVWCADLSGLLGGTSERPNP